MQLRKGTDAHAGRGPVRCRGPGGAGRPLLYKEPWKSQGNASVSVSHLLPTNGLTLARGRPCQAARIPQSLKKDTEFCDHSGLSWNVVLPPGLHLEFLKPEISHFYRLAPST